MLPNPGYVLAQLRRAAASAEHNADASVRERAHARTLRWMQVLEGMASGALDIGTRTAVRGVPPWVTLDVVQGGFATGGLAASGPLQAHELALMERLRRPVDATARAALNLHFLGEEGQRELLDMLESGCYRVNVPEEGALLTLAWLLAHGQHEAARLLLEQVTPFLDQLRFYPVPDDRPLAPSLHVCRQPVGETVRGLQAAGDNPRIQRMNEALGLWLPLYDRTVALFLETVQGEPPKLVTASSVPGGNTARTARRVEGGWPCRVYPSGWRERAQALLAHYARVRAANPHGKKPDDPRENFPRLRAYLARCLTVPTRLSERDISTIRYLLACFVTRHSLPGSPGLERLRSEQRRVASLPTHADFRRVLVQRLSHVPSGEGLESLEPFSAPLSAEEAGHLRTAPGTSLPAPMVRKLERSWQAPVETLVARGILPSGDELARVLPQMTSQVQAAGLADRTLRRLDGAVYAAFRRRRSLLLLDLSHQVRREELPWVSALQSQRAAGLNARETSRQVLEQLVVLALTAFPHAIFPNKLLQEFRALAHGAGLDMPLVDELAADIFTGEFTAKFVHAARTAARLLRGSLYARYYGVPYEAVLRIDDVGRGRARERGTSKAFAAVCERLARTDRDVRWSVARNGKVLEQCQIVTTQNLASVFDGLGLAEGMRAQLPTLALETFRWVCGHLSVRVSGMSAELHHIKAAAYAWRQMLFFLSLLGEDAQWAHLAAAREHLATRDGAFRARFRPALEGLAFVLDGGAFDADGRGGEAGEFRRFLGWATEHHWLRAAG